jgi:uncharacterized iron-regulated membrane protein
MKSLRTVVFWLHLAAGVVAGVVILVMSATGAALALKPQILNAVEKDVRFVTPPSVGSRLGVQALLVSAQRARPDARPATVTLHADPAAAAAVSLGRDAAIYVDPYSGRVLGEGSPGAQRLFRTMEDWHRWLGVTGEQRASARAVTGASNLAFLILAITGPCLWLPRTWSWSNVRGVLWFRPTRGGRARDFNWHNVIGLWCAPILIVLTITGVVMSYPWANGLLFRLAGTPPPVAGGGGGSAGQAPGEEGRPAPLPENFDAIWSKATEQVPTWRTITARVPARANAPVVFTISDARSWNAFARSQLTVSVADGTIAKWEPYDATTRGQKWRGWVRFGHTGELGGPAGQIVAGIACVSGAVLVWTGLALAFRRWIAWCRGTARSTAKAA